MEHIKFQQKLPSIIDDFFSTWKRGDRIPRDWFEKKFEINFDVKGKNHKYFDNLNLQFMANLSSLQEELLREFKIHLDNDRQSGYSGHYLVVEADQQVPRAYKKGISDIKKVFHKTKKIMKNVDSRLLSNEEKARDNALLANISNLEALIETNRSRAKKIAEL